MSFFDTKSGNVSYDNKIVYNFYRTTVNKNEIQSPVTNSSVNYFKAAFLNNGAEPNFYYTNNGSTDSYVSKNVYFYGLLHNNITGISDNNPNMIGELVIELTSSSSKPAYVCFLLEKPPPYGAPPTGDIDNLLGLASSTAAITTDVVINNSITTQETAIVYSNNNATIFIFTEPIVVSSDSYQTIKNFDTKTSLFSANAPTAYNIIPSRNIQIKQEDQIYISCNPTGVSEDTISTYNLPINSELMNEKQDMDYMKTSVNFAVFSLVLVGCYFVVPPFYKFMVIDKIMRLVKSGSVEVDTNAAADKVLTRIRSADILIGAFFVLVAFIMFTFGISTNNTMMFYGTLFVLLFYGLSLSLIGLHKTFDPFLMTFLNGNKVDSSYKDAAGQPKEDRWFNFKDMTGFLGSVAEFMIFKSGVQILVSSLFIFFILLIMWFMGQFNSLTLIMLSFLCCALIVPVVVAVISAINVANEGS